MLKEEYGQEKAVLAAHNREIIDIQVIKVTKYSKIKQFYETLRKNYEALRAMNDHTKDEGLVLSTLAKQSLREMINVEKPGDPMPF